MANILRDALEALIKTAPAPHKVSSAYGLALNNAITVLAAADLDANARLIAAAPELLEALRKVDSYLAEMQRANIISGDLIRHHVRAAIAKAEGKV